MIAFGRGGGEGVTPRQSLAHTPAHAGLIPAKLRVSIPLFRPHVARVLDPDGWLVFVRTPHRLPLHPLFVRSCSAIAKVLYHLANPDVPKFMTTCNVCFKELHTGDKYHCETCQDYDLCPVSLLLRGPRCASRFWFCMP